MFTRSVRAAAIALGVATAAVIPLVGPASAAEDIVTITSTSPTQPGEVRINWDSAVGYDVDYYLITDYDKSKSNRIGGNDGLPTDATTGLFTFLSYSTTYNVTVVAVGVDANNQTASASVRLQGYRLLSKPNTYTLNRGQTVKITGSLHKEGTNVPVGNAQIKLQAQPAGSANWTTVDTATTNNQGEFSTGHAPSRNTEYRTWYSGDGAGGWRTPIPIGVRVAITRKVSPNPVNFGQSAKFNGKVRAPSSLVSGQTIRLQRETTGGWNTVGTGTVNGSSRYSINYTSPNRGDATFRLLLPENKNFKVSVSKSVRLTVN